MKTPFELELEVTWWRERLLAEAESERLAGRLRKPRRSVVRARLAASLYALADWLNAVAYGLVGSEHSLPPRQQPAARP
jgi:hypothetical protein